MQTSDWMIVYGMSETDVSCCQQESLMTLGNGYLAWRGAPVWSQISGLHHPGLYAAGLQNSAAKGKMINLPNPQLMRFIVNGTPVSFDKESIVDRRSFIDFERGIQSDRYTVHTAEGFISLTTSKYADPYNFHAIGFEGSFSATFDGNLLLESLIDGSSEASGNNEFSRTRVSDRLLCVDAFGGTNIEIAIAAKTFVNGRLIEQVEGYSEKQMLERTRIHFKANETVKFEKVIDIATSLEVERAAEVARRDVNSLPLSSIKENSAKYWAEVWTEADVKVELAEPLNSSLQRLTHLCIFRLRQAAQHSANQYLNASLILPEITADSGNSLLPYYIANTPETARDLLTDLLRHTDSASLATASNLCLYEQFTADRSLLKEGGLEFFLKSLKFCINKAEQTEDGRHHNEDDSAYTNHLLTTSLKWLFTLPKILSTVSELNLQEAAMQTGFDDKVFRKAQELAKKLSLDNNIQENDNEKVLRRLVEKFDNADSASPVSPVSLSEMASLVKVIQNGFAGVSLSDVDGVLTLAPNLPGSWHNLVFNQKIHGVKLNIEITERLLILTADQDLTVRVYGVKANLKAGILSTFALKK
ncbi:glycosyl hydrolase family 65 protein [Lactovum odontotermitis]